MASARSVQAVVIMLCFVATIASGCGDVDTGHDNDRSSGAQNLFSTDLATRLREHEAKTGDVQASLLWNNYNDLDLHVIDPYGEHIYFAHKRAQSGGELDVDMNAGGPESNKPVENIYFPHGKTPAGHYKVLVHHYANHGSPDPTSYRCEVLVGNKVHKFSGALSSGDSIRTVYEFTLGERNADIRPRQTTQFKLFSPVDRQ